MTYATSAINIRTNKKLKKTKLKPKRDLNETDKAYSDSDSYSLYPITPQIRII